MGKINLNSNENLNENYKITIVDKHSSNGEKSESKSELMGDLNYAQNGYIIRYVEHAGDFAGAMTKIFVKEPDTVRLSRGGELALEILLEGGKRHSCFYDTPFGKLQMGVFAKSVCSRMTEHGGRLSFSYTLDVGGGEVSENELIIDVKEIHNV